MGSDSATACAQKAKCQKIEPKFQKLGPGRNIYIYNLTMAPDTVALLEN